MSRYKLRAAGQPWWLQAAFWLFETAASLKLAVILVFAAAIILAWGTFVESQYGLEAAQFGVYGTWWFTLLNVMFAVSIFCAAAIRYPWKRQQTGFVITHIGLLTLLFGMLLSRVNGIDAQMPIWEGMTNYKAYLDSQHFQLVEQDASSTPKILPKIPFTSGTFNWRDYGHTWLPKKDGGLFWFPWLVAHRDVGTIHDSDGVKLEVLDYYANAAEIGIPFLDLKISGPAMTRMGSDGRERTMPATWSNVPLSIAAPRDPRFRPSARQTVGGGQLVFWMTDSPAETTAFLDSRPTLPIGPNGQVVLSVGGQRVAFSVDEKLGQPAFDLGDSKLKAQVVKYVPVGVLAAGAVDGKLRLLHVDPDEPAENAAVELAITDAEGQSRQMILFADQPERNQTLTDLGVFGVYWFDYGERDAATLMRGQGGSRIDLLQGADQKLYYRYWNRKEVVEAKPLPTDGTHVDAFKMPIGQLSMYVERFIPSPEAARDVLPLPFDKTMNSRDLDRAAKLRMTVDGHSEEFWLLGPRLNPYEDTAPRGLERHSVKGDGRTVAVMLDLDTVDVGFDVRLNRFQRKLDPGTDQASHYGSTVDFETQDGGDKLARDVSISMNAPVDFRDPTSGRKYRLFQEAFQGPFEAGDGSSIVEVVYGPETVGERFMTILTVNYDPGRGVKYAGCLLVIAGIFTMFYMRAYFFKPAPKGVVEKPADSEDRELVASARE